MSKMCRFRKRKHLDSVYVHVTGIRFLLSNSFYMYSVRIHMWTWAVCVCSVFVQDFPGLHMVSGVINVL